MRRRTDGVRRDEGCRGATRIGVPRLPSPSPRTLSARRSGGRNTLGRRRMTMRAPSDGRSARKRLAFIVKAQHAL